MTDIPKEYIIPNTNISNFSVFDLLKYVDNGSFIDQKDFKEVYPISLELNAGVFSKNGSIVEFPLVSVSQTGATLITTCSCTTAISAEKMCEHQAEILFCILGERKYRMFFDQFMRQEVLEQAAKGYGLEKETNLDAYFQLNLIDGRLQIEPRIKELLQMDAQTFEKNLIPIKNSLLKSLAKSEIKNQQILVIGKHRYYNQLNFLLMESDMTKSGKIKNPINNIDPMPFIWKSKDPQEVKFYSAVVAFQNKFNEDNLENDLEALRVIVQNPLELKVYYHDRTVSDTISTKSLKAVSFVNLKAEVQLTVFKKDPFYEITGELLFNDLKIPFKKVIIKNEYFLYHQHKFYLIDNPDLLRVIKFFKGNNEFLLLHSSKYEEFLQTVLAPLEQLVHINYSYIRQASPVQLAEKQYALERILYFQQEGNYVSITPVMKYGDIEVPVYSRKQLFDQDQNANVFQVERNKLAEDQLTTTVMGQHPEFEEQLKGYEYFYLHKDKFLDDNWFLGAFEFWRNEGITLLGFNEIKNNKINPHKAKINIDIISGTDWFNAKLKVAYGNQQASLKQIRRAIRNKSKFVQLDDGSQGILPEEWLGKIAHYFRLGEIEDDLLLIPKINFSEVSDLFEKEMLSVEVQEEINLYTRRFSHSSKIPECKVPDDLHAELRDYQKQGLDWLNFLDQHNFGGCLADDMGLGKTLQIIAFILSQREKHPNQTNLIVVPTSLLFNWEEEFAKFAPSIKVWKHYGANRDKSISELAKYEVILTSYGMLLSDIKFLKSFQFNYVFLDESQAIKNPNSERYKAARLLQARNRIVLTGTPIENNTFDLYGQLSFACPGLLGSKQYFKDVYAIPIDRFEYNKRAQELQHKIDPFILRRTKKQVAKELPEKTEMVIYCEMNAEQRKIYDNYETELREFISANEEEDVHKNSMHVLTGLTKLRQICNAPILLKEGHAAEHAVKIEVLMEQIESKSNEHKILVFSQFVGMLDLIKAELVKRDISFEYLTGQTKDRGKKVHNFQSNDQVRVFLISLKAGGVGLNLIQADYVYLIDPWWNPAAESQAIDRSYRIGQTKNVVAVRLICSNSIEEKIMKLQQKKSKLAQELVKTEASFFNGLSKQDLLEIL